MKTCIVLGFFTDLKKLFFLRTFPNCKWTCLGEVTWTVSDGTTYGCLRKNSTKVLWLTVSNSELLVVWSWYKSFSLSHAHTHTQIWCNAIQFNVGRKTIVGIATLRAGRCGDRISVGARFSAHLQSSPGAHPASYLMGPGRGVDPTPICRRG